MEFNKRFSSEKACRDYLYRIRWPEGYQCRRCFGKESWENRRGLIECKNCGHQISITAGTVMEGTRKSLQEWFNAMWWISTQKTGGSAKGLQKLLALGSYQTAWTWLHKLRVAMVRSDREPLSGKVEVDDGFVGGEEEDVRGRQTIKKAKIVVAIEIPDKTRKGLGRIRIKHIPDFSGESLVGFAQENIAVGSTTVTDGWRGYAGFGSHGYHHEVIKGDPELLPNVHRVISLLKRWLLGTHQGAVRHKHLQSYLDEFTFRHNRRKVKQVGKIFYRLVQGAMITEAKHYKNLVSTALT